MSGATNEDGAGRPAGFAAVLVAVVAAVAIAAFASLAFAKASALLKTAGNSSLRETLVVNAKGRTVYELRPETSHHLLCKSSECLQFWPMVKAPKSGRLSATGVKGKLGRIRRGKVDQLTLNGDPLYTYAGDSSSGMTSGNGIRSFGGTWHVVSEGKLSAAGTTTSTTNPSPTTTTTTTTMTPPPTTTSTYHWA